MISEKKSMILLIILTCIVGYVALNNPLFSTKHTKTVNQTTINKEPVYTKQQIKDLLLRKYIFERSKYTPDDPTIYRIVSLVRNIIDEDYSKLTNIKEIMGKDKLQRLVIAIMEQESGFDPYSLSGKKAIGIMQILPTQGNLRYISKYIDFEYTRELFDLRKNIKAGLLLLDHDIKIAKNLLKDKKPSPDVILRKSLNIYSNDKSGKYTLEILEKMTTLKGFLDLKVVDKRRDYE